MQSWSNVACSTGFMLDSETSSMMDQYGPGSGLEVEGAEPSARWRVGSLVVATGWLLGE